MDRAKKTELVDEVAAVDLGSNSFHMVVARSQSGEITVIDRLKEMVRLAAGLDEKRILDRKSQKRGLDCLRRFGQRVEHLPRGAVRAIGTNTLRSARNADEFLAEAEAALGHSIDTVSGIEEARLIFLGVSHSLPDAATRRLVVDIGGGSTEVIVGEGYRPLVLDSFYVGCVSLSREYFGSGQIDAAAWRRAEVSALRELEAVQARYKSLGWEKAQGASGTIQAVESVVTAAGWSRKGITSKALRKLRDAMFDAGHVDQLKFEGLAAERREVFPGGVALLMAVFDTFGIKRMEHASGALREGLLYSLVRRLLGEDARRDAIAALSERYHVDPTQAERVERTALRMLSQVAEEWKLNDEDDAWLLSCAAQVHEIGLDIAHASYHKHGAYVIANSDLTGFTRVEQRRLATLVRAHRRRFPVSVLSELPRRRRRTIERLAVLLRLAVILNRSRSAAHATAPTVSVGKRSIRLEFPGGWLDERSLTNADLQQEQSYLRAADIRLDFE